MSTDSDTIRIARPKISVEGQDQPGLAQGLLSMRIAETTAGLYDCEIVVGNWGPGDGQSPAFLYFDRSLLDFGKTLKVTIGNDTIFEGRISAIEGRFPEGAQVELGVLAEDRFQDLRMTRRTQLFENVSDSDLFNQIASAHGLSPSIDVVGPTHKVLAQVNQSDLAFLRDRARSIDAEVWMDGTTLHVQRRAARRRGAALTLGYGHELREVAILADLAHQRTALTISGWDVSGKQAISYEAGDSVLGNELGNYTSGASVVQNKFGQRKETVVHSVPQTSTEAQARAEGHFRTLARTFVTVRGVADTDPGLRVGAYVELKGVGPLFEGNYYVTDVAHIFDGSDAGGLRTEFSAERPGLGQPS
jgi:phage protein D